MDRSVLVQYSEVMEEIKDLRERIRKLDRFLSDPPVVSDTVRGTRKDGTIGPIKITGIPVPEYSRKEKIRERYREMLEEKGGRAPGADLQGRGIHRVDPEGRDPDHVPAVLH